MKRKTPMIDAEEMAVIGGRGRDGEERRREREREIYEEERGSDE